jgi:RNA polymerase sigma-70 factor (ECF subfamily)
MPELDELVQRCRRGDRNAFDALFSRYESRLYRLAAVILRDRQDAEDALQDIFLRIYDRIHDFRGESSFETWLTAIALNLCRDRLRRRQVRRAVSLDWLRDRASKMDVSRVAADRQQRQSLWALVDQLDEKYRLPIILYYHEHLSCEEIGGVLNIRTNTVYARLFHARMRLREMLQSSDIKGIEPGLWGTSFIENEN